MDVFLIDFENVNESYLKGIESLNQQDLLIIFHNQKQKFSGITLDSIISSKAHKKEIIGTEKNGKEHTNYLDFQLSTYLGYLIGQGYKANYHIISKDIKLTTPLIDFWKDRGIIIKQQLSIKDESISQTENKESINSKKVIEPKDKKQTVTKTKVTPQKNIKISLPESWKKRIRKAVKEDNIQNNEYKTIYFAILNCDSKTKLNNQLRESLPKEKYISVYKHIKDIYADYRLSLTKD